MRLKSFALFCAASVFWPAVLHATEFKIEPGWSSVEFSVKNFGINTVEGHFTVYAGTVDYNESDVTLSSVTVTIQAASLDTGIKKRDAHLRSAEFFDVDKTPEITFHAERITKTAGGYRMSGPLTIKGHTKNIDLPFTFSVEKSEQGSAILRGQAHGVIDRHDFGLDYGSNFSVGRQIQIRIAIQTLP